MKYRGFPTTNEAYHDKNRKINFSTIENLELKRMLKREEEELDLAARRSLARIEIVRAVNHPEEEPKPRVYFSG
jgi:hypothetical protein